MNNLQTQIMEIKTISTSRVTISQDVKELSELIQFLVLLLNSSVSALEDGVVNYKDTFKFISLIPLIPESLNGVKLIPGELRDLSEEEIYYLTSIVSSNLVLPRLQSQEVVTLSTNLALDFVNLFNKIKALKSK